MIIDLIFLNSIMWSGIFGYFMTSKKLVAKLLVLIFSIMITKAVADQISIISYEKVIDTLNKKDYIVEVIKEPVKDYLIIKGFIEELPVTTEIQNRILEEYYKDNTEYVADELLNITGNLMGQLLEILIIFVFITILLQIIMTPIVEGKLLGQKVDIKRESFLTSFINILLNFVIIGICVITLNWISYFLLDKFPEINLQGSIFKPMVYKVLDIILHIV